MERIVEPCFFFVECEFAVVLPVICICDNSLICFGLLITDSQTGLNTFK